LAAYTVYLLIIPEKFYGSKFDKIFTKSVYALFLFTIIFSFLAEITFWDEYQKRFNFIAVDYLLYTYEVIGNIHQSYPLPLLIGGIILLTYGGIKAVKNVNAYENTFQKEGSFKEKIVLSILIFSVFFSFHLGVNNTDAEVFENNFENELAKAGVYSFFAAYQSNELNYYDFYLHNDTKTAYQDLRKLISVQGDSLLDESKTIRRKVSNSGLELKPNVVFIGLESLNATFMKTFGNEEDWTPNLEKLANESVFLQICMLLERELLEGWKELHFV
jgi:phosphoglycerol transferase MdoB-like AlkP superfamily enzyme